MKDINLMHYFVGLEVWYVDIMVVAGGIKPPCVTLTRIEYSGK
jgi:hypothetical protein